MLRVDSTAVTHVAIRASGSSAPLAALADPAAAGSSEVPAKRRRPAHEVVRELAQLTALLDPGDVRQEELAALEEELLSGNCQPVFPS